MNYLLSQNKLYRIYYSKNNNVGNLEILNSFYYNFEFKHIMMTMDSGSGTKQFSQFYMETIDGIRYIFPSDRITSINTSNSIFFGNEIFDNTINNNGSFAKACFGNISYSTPLKFCIDVRSEPINIRRYCKWGWYTSNDTSEYPERNMENFSLWVSNSDKSSQNIPYDEWIKIGGHQLSEYEKIDYAANFKKVGPYDVIYRPQDHI